MPITIEGRKIDRVIIIDDDKELREEYGYSIEELGLTPIYEAGPLRDLDESLQEFRRKADAIVCDYHLRIKNFSQFDGDQLVASSNSANFPALLCSNFNDADIMVLRSKRRFIPTLLKLATYNPETIQRGLARCFQESDGQFDPSRKPWRTLVRVVQVEESGRYFYVVVPGWDADQKIRIYFQDVPAEMQKLIKSGQRLYAQVNTGADTTDELYFCQWETQ